MMVMMFSLKKCLSRHDHVDRDDVLRPSEQNQHRQQQSTEDHIFLCLSRPCVLILVPATVNVDTGLVVLCLFS